VLAAADIGSGEDHGADADHARQHDGIASLDDLLKFFVKLPNPDKQFTVMSGFHTPASSRRTT